MDNFHIIKLNEIHRQNEPFSYIDGGGEKLTNYCSLLKNSLMNLLDTSPQNSGKYSKIKKNPLKTETSKSTRYYK